MDFDRTKKNGTKYVIKNVENTKFRAADKFFSSFHLFTILEPYGMCASEEQQINEPKLMPSINEVVHFENESYIVTCDGGGVRVRWFSPNNTWVDPINRGRVHVEEKNSESALVFTSITPEDKGNWTCEAENNPQRIGFNMIVYSKRV